VTATFKDIIGYEGFYQISDTGFVKSVKRIDCRGRKVGGNILKAGNKTQNGRTVSTHVSLAKDRKNKIAKVHRLVANAFLGDNNGLLVLHKDGDATNNDINNLYYGSHKDNGEDAKRHGSTLRGEKQHFAILTEKQVLEILKSNHKYGTGIKLARKFNVSQSTISSIRKGRNWGWINACLV